MTKKKADKAVLFLDALSRFLGDNLAAKSILLQVESERSERLVGPFPSLAKDWAELYGYIAHGYQGRDEIRKVLKEWFGK